MRRLGHARGLSTGLDGPRTDPVVQQLRREQEGLLVELAKAEQQVIGILREFAKAEPAVDMNSRIDRIVALRSELDRVHHGSVEYAAMLERILAESRAILRLSR